MKIYTMKANLSLMRAFAGVAGLKAAAFIRSAPEQMTAQTLGLLGLNPWLAAQNMQADVEFKRNLEVFASNVVMLLKGNVDAFDRDAMEEAMINIRRHLDGSLSKQFDELTELLGKVDIDELAAVRVREIQFTVAEGATEEDKKLAILRALLAEEAAKLKTANDQLDADDPQKLIVPKPLVSMVFTPEEELQRSSLIRSLKDTVLDLRDKLTQPEPISPEGPALMGLFRVFANSVDRTMLQLQFSTLVKMLLHVSPKEVEFLTPEEISAAENLSSFSPDISPHCLQLYAKFCTGESSEPSSPSVRLFEQAQHRHVVKAKVDAAAEDRRYGGGGWAQ